MKADLIEGFIDGVEILHLEIIIDGNHTHDDIDIDYDMNLLTNIIRLIYTISVLFIHKKLDAYAPATSQMYIVEKWIKNGSKNQGI